MLPANYASLANDELVKFLADNSDPLIQDLCFRLDEKNHNDLIGLEEAKDNLEEAETRIESLESDNYSLENDLEIANDRIEKLEEFIEEHNLQIPK